MICSDGRLTGSFVINSHHHYLSRRYNTNTGKHNELVGMDMKRSMEDLFYKYQVNVAYSGHVHVYERFLPIYKNVTTLNATIYMTVGVGGNPYGMILLTNRLLRPLSFPTSFSFLCSLLTPLLMPLLSCHSYRL